MAKNSVRDFDATAANNTDIQSVDIAENCAPSGINNAIRELMADIKNVSTGTIALESPSADSLTVTGDLTVDTNTLYVDSTNNRVGVGVTSGLGSALTIARNNSVGFMNAAGTASDQIIYGDSSSNLRFYTLASEAARLDSSGRLLVGKTTNAIGTAGHTLQADGFFSATRSAAYVAGFNRLSDDGEIVQFFKDGTTVGSIGTIGYIYIGKGDTGIGFASDAVQPVNTDTPAARDNGIDLGASGNRFKDLYLGGNAQFGSSDAGTVVSQTSGGGHALQSTSYAGFSRESGAADQAVIILNDTGSGGKVIGIRKDGVNVGAIGTASGYPFIAAPSDFSLMLVTSDFRPRTVNGDSNNDNAIDVGASAARFDDVYATNGTIQTSDQNEKQEIASLTDAEITAAKAISKLFKTFKWNDSVEEKGDAARTHAGVIAQDVQQAMTDAGLDAGDYAFFISATWWETQTEVPAVEAVEAVDAVYDDDGNLVSEAVEAVEAQDAYTRIESYDTAEEAPEGATERTRLGIRYPELLAFVGAATEQRLADIETRLSTLENA